MKREREKKIKQQKQMQDKTKQNNRGQWGLYAK